MAPLRLALVGSLAASASALAPASTPLVSRKLALQEFGIAAAGVLGGATLFAPPAEALTQEEKDALYQEFKAKKERKQDLRRANSVAPPSTPAAAMPNSWSASLRDTKGVLAGASALAVPATTASFRIGAMLQLVTRPLLLQLRERRSLARTPLRGAPLLLLRARIGGRKTGFAATS